MNPELAPASVAQSSNLAAALRLLPGERRADALVFYRFCRAVDDISDSTTLPPEEKERMLGAWSRAVSTGCGLPGELAAVIKTRRLHTAHLLAIIEGCASDVRPAPFPDLAALDKYCWKVAGAVGLVSIRIFGCEDPASDAYAERLGRALQLTNILRDAREDAARGRVYFPSDMLEKCGCGRALLLEGRPGPAFQKAAALLASEARADFQRARPPLRDRRALLPAMVMAAVYRELLETMARDGFRVFERRYAVPGWKKTLLALRLILAVRARDAGKGRHARR